MPINFNTTFNLHTVQTSGYYIAGTESADTLNGSSLADEAHDVDGSAPRAAR